LRPSVRFIQDGAMGAHANLALEEAILQENPGLVVRVWSNERSVIIGRGQLAGFETDLKYCEGKGIPVVRRVTAGGAVYNGPGNVNWSLFIGSGFDSGAIRYIWGVREVFRMAAEVVTQATESCGVGTWLESPNRILSEGGKVSGMAAYVSRKGLLCHGTLLLDADLGEAKRLTDPSSTKLDRRYTRSNAMTMANTGIQLPSFIAAMKGVVAVKTSLPVETDEPNEREKSVMLDLLPKYRDPLWNLGDPFEA
jgi:lipoate---protein ligase